MFQSKKKYIFLSINLMQFGLFLKQEEEKKKFQGVRKESLLHNFSC